ncbi:MAG: PEP-CTERM sorting domain-containing protein [Planctomycetes bacterium]|nr:PEP-CTERM sorting domain-containing protein [Planctomycetota bacterium]
MPIMSIMSKNIITIGLFCLLSSQVFACPVKVEIDKEGTQLNWFSDLKVKGDEIYTVDFDGVSGLGDLGMGIISKSHKINAIHQLDSGKFVLSTYSHIHVGSERYESGDLFEYNPNTGQSSLYFSGKLFDKKENIDAVYVRSNGNVVFSTKDDAKLANVSFGKGDIVEYDPVADQLNILMDGGTIGSNGNVQAVHLLDDGDILFSIHGPSKLNDLKVHKGDLFRFDVQSGTTSLAATFDEVLHGKDIEGFTGVIPEPASVMLLMAGALALLGNRRKMSI